MEWNPDRYLRFVDERTRPGVELLARVPQIDAHRIVDLGCGTGHLTAMLAARWPHADVSGLDASTVMISRARDRHPSITWTAADIAAWEPDGPVDLIYSNAALHWLDDHENLFRRLRSYLAPGGVLAVQMPDNWSAPSHRIPVDVLAEDAWPEAARAAVLRDRLSAPGAYATWVQPAEVDLWKVTYYQRLTGADPVWEWVTGSLLLPILATLGPDDCARFADRCKDAYRDAYPADPDGVTTLPFGRLFIVATAPST